MGHGGMHHERKTLARCYEASLDLAKVGLSTIDIIATMLFHSINERISSMLAVAIPELISDIA